MSNQNGALKKSELKQQVMKASALPLVEMVGASRLIPYARNSRKHSEEQVSQIAASMREFGFTIPLLVDEELTVLAGHGRLMAAKRLGFEEVPCIVTRGWSDAQKRAYVIADNKLAANSSWDYELLAVELGDLAANGGTDVTGFSASEIDSITRAASNEYAAPVGVDAADAVASFDVIVTCGDENAQRELLERMNAEGFKCRALLR